MVDNLFPLPKEALTVERVARAFQRNGSWTPCRKCGSNHWVLIPEGSPNQSLTLDVTIITSGETISRSAVVAVVCLTCGIMDLFDYAILAQMIEESEGMVR